MKKDSNNIFRKAFIIVKSSVFALILAAVVAPAQSVQTGTWEAKVKDWDKERVKISFYREDMEVDSKHKGKYQISGHAYEINELRGLGPGQLRGANSPVRFSIVREAGTIDLTGTFTDGAGSGTWTFTPNASFVASMRSFGFENISDKKLFASAVLDVRTATVSDLRASGIRNLEYDDVFKATIFKIDGQYIREMSAAGFANLDMEDLVKGRIFKIDANYAREISTLGFGEQSLEQLVKFRIFKITPEFLAQMKAEGLGSLSAEEVVKLRIFKIDGEFIQSARAKGYVNPTVEELVELKIHGKVK